MKKFLLLDVDGAMIGYPNGDCPQPPFFNSEPVEALKMILASDIRIEIILSSSMRIHARDKFDRMFESAGLPLDRVVGETRWEGSLKPNREREIKHFLYNRCEDAMALPVDDEVMEGVCYMKTNSITGLTIRDAEVCIEFFKGNAVHCQADHFGLGLTYITKRDDEL